MAGLFDNATYADENEARLQQESARYLQEYLAQIARKQSRDSRVIGIGSGVLGLAGGIESLLGAPMLGVPMMMTGVAGMSKSNELNSAAQRNKAGADMWGANPFSLGGPRVR